MAPSWQDRIVELQRQVAELYPALRAALDELDELRAQRQRLRESSQSASPPRLRVIAGGRS